MLRVVCVLAMIGVVGCGEATRKPDAGPPKGDGSDVADRAVDMAGEDRGNIGADVGADVAADVAAEAPGEAAAMDVSSEAGDDTAINVDAGAVDGDAASSDADAASEAGDAAEVAEPKSASVTFTGSVVTVAPKADGGMPLGFDTTVRTKPVTGSFSYNLGYVDDTPSATMGHFERFGKMAFSLMLEGHTVTGSGKGWLETVSVGSSDTFRFIDGKQPLDNGVRIMKIDGVDAPTLKLWIAITDSTGALLTSDALPAPFPTVDIKNTPHTFELTDSGGTLLLQLDTLVSQP